MADRRIAPTDPRPATARAAMATRMLNIPPERQMPRDPIKRFKTREELVRRATNIALTHLWRMERELEVVARAARGRGRRRFLLVDGLNHYAGALMAEPGRTVVAIVDKARALCTALEAPARPSLRVLRGGKTS